jgi:hypothetical protein
MGRNVQSFRIQICLQVENVDRRLGAIGLDMDRVGSAVVACRFTTYFLEVIVGDCGLDLIFTKAYDQR